MICWATWPHQSYGKYQWQQLPCWCTLITHKRRLWRGRNILFCEQEHNLWTIIRKHSPRYWPELPIIYNSPRTHVCMPQWHRQLLRQTRRFFQYHRWLLIEYKATNKQKSPTQVSNAQLDGGSKSHVFTDINIFT